MDKEKLLHAQAWGLIVYVETYYTMEVTKTDQSYVQFCTLLSKMGRLTLLDNNLSTFLWTEV